MQSSGLKKYTFIIIPILFLLYAAPSALDYVFHFPDEKYYTDSVIQMIAHHDYFTPYKADGTFRFLKPITTYWVILASYKLFGVSVFSSRVFFWLAGALLVLLTYLMAKSISGKTKIAVLAAFITASNPLVLLSASRSIPDILLVLFLTTSAWGFIEIMLHPHPKKLFYWMAYLGAAFAFETKGLPAAAFSGLSMLFLLLNPWKKIPLKKIFDPYSLIISILVAISWFIIMYTKHGSVYLSSFFADQVGERISSKSTQVFGNAGLGVLYLIAYLIPWIFIVLSQPLKLKNFIPNLSKEKKSIFGFILSWIILVLLMAGAVFKFYDRYLLPVIPLISILFAFIIVNIETKFKKAALWILLGLNLLLITLSVLYAVFIQTSIILWMGVFISLTLGFAYFKKLFPNISIEILIANVFLLFFFNTFILMSALLMPNPGKQLVEHLKAAGLSEKQEVYVYGNIRTASNIRIQGKNQFKVISMDTIFTIPATPQHFLVFNNIDKTKLNLKNYIISEGSVEWSAVPVERFPEFIRPSIIQIKNNGTRYLIAKPKN